MAQLGSSKIFGDLQVTGDIKYNDQIISGVMTGTAPLDIASTTLVTNLNADLLDGKHASDFAPGYSYGTSDLTAGSSSLTTGKLHFVYE